MCKGVEILFLQMSSNVFLTEKLEQEITAVIRAASLASVITDPSYPVFVSLCSVRTLGYSPYKHLQSSDGNGTAELSELALAKFNSICSHPGCSPVFTNLFHNTFHPKTVHRLLFAPCLRSFIFTYATSACRNCFSCSVGTTNYVGRL